MNQQFTERYYLTPSHTHTHVLPPLLLSNYNNDEQVITQPRQTKVLSFQGRCHSSKKMSLIAVEVKIKEEEKEKEYYEREKKEKEILLSSSPES